MAITVTVVDDTTDVVIFRRSVDLTQIEPDASTNEAHDWAIREGASEAEWNGRLAAHIAAAVELCPFDCDHCREE